MRSTYVQQLPEKRVDGYYDSQLQPPIPGLQLFPAGDVDVEQLRAECLAKMREQEDPCPRIAQLPGRESDGLFVVCDDGSGRTTVDIFHTVDPSKRQNNKKIHDLRILDPSQIGLWD